MVFGGDGLVGTSVVVSNDGGESVSEVGQGGHNAVPWWDAGDVGGVFAEFIAGDANGFGEIFDGLGFVVAFVRQAIDDGVGGVLIDGFASHLEVSGLEGFEEVSGEDVSVRSQGA